VPKNAVSAYAKLASVDEVRGIVGGTWWANSFVKSAERDGTIVMSCETLYNGDTVSASSYFLLHGDLRKWVRIYEPLVSARRWTRGAVVHFVSGFGQTIAEEMKAIFSKPGRTLVADIEYGSVDMADVGSILLELKQARPEVVYVDAQPGGLATFVRKLREAGLGDVTVITNSIGDDMLRSKLVEPSSVSNLFFTRRASFDPAFAEKFRRRFGKEPYLEADLGYVAVGLLQRALATDDAVGTLESGIELSGVRYHFDEHRVYSGIPQEIQQVIGGVVTPWKEQTK
jgi:hypothetical protein